MKKAISLSLAILMLFSALPQIVFAVNAESGQPTVCVENVYAAPGSTVDVEFNLTNNPGIISLELVINFDPSLTLVAAKSGEVFSGLSPTFPPELEEGKPIQSSCTFSWGASDLTTDQIKDGNILKVTFQVASDAKLNYNCPISISYIDANAINGKDVIPVTNIKPIDGGVQTIDYIPGDVNEDGKITMLDYVLISRYIVDGRKYNPNGYGVRLREEAADVNDDGKITMMDYILISRYIVDGRKTNPNGYNVKLLPSTPKCTHDLTETPAKSATCTSDGNIAYWHCTKCNKYFKDENCIAEIALSDTVIPATDHTIVIDLAVAPTYDKTGLTEGSHCSVCKTVIRAQEVIPKLEKSEYSITYHIANNDNYLQSLNIENPNPTSYTSEDGLKLSNITVDGYVFEGWYDGQGANGELVKNIPVGEKGNIDLYARWTPVVYNVQYKSDIFVDKDKDSYTVNEGLTLPIPRLSNYIFTGWTDDHGNLYEDGVIPVGTTGPMTLTANWTSERNKTFTKPKLDAPIIVEDDKNNMIFFTYEIGEIQNVPVYTIHDFGYISGDGITQTQTEKFSTKISDTMMDSFAKSVSNATTKSSNWTLSKDWNENTSIDEQSYTEKGLTKEEAETIAKSNSKTWNVSSGSSGSSSTISVTTNNDGWSNQAKVDAHSSHKDYQDNSLSVKAGLSAKVGNIGGSIDAGGETKWGNENSSSANIYASTNKDHAESRADTASSSSSWNNSSSFGGSSTNSTSRTTSNIISEKIAKTYGYGKTYSQGGASSEAQGLQSTQSEGSEYESAVTYSKETAQEIESTWTTQATKAGYHRWVMVGKAHVFAVVGYDMTTESFFTYTYSVMDDTEPLKQFEDYSYTTGSYNDAENGVIPFEVPFEVAEYVAERTCYSDGLKIDQATGVITGYTGTDDFVIIPEYMNVGGGDVVKVTGISSNAFKGNTYIKEVRLSDFITEIPNNAFENCTSLFGLTGGSIASIGSNAFKNCTSMEIVSVDSGIKTIGNNAFDGCEYLLVNAANKGVAEATVKSGAKNIQLYINGEIIEGGQDAFGGTTLEVPNGTDSFTLFGYGYTYPGLSIVSDANKTVINKMNFVDTDSIPLKISSPNVTLNQVSACTEGIGIVLSANSTNLLMQGNILVTTQTDKSVLCKNITFGESNDKVVGTLTVSGKVYVAGNVSGSEYLAHKGDEIVYIDDTMFDNFLNSHNIVFNANGGSVSEANRAVVYGSSLGTLPTPKRDYYNFIGWFTKADGGEEVTANTIFNSTEDVTLYAHWTQNALSGWVKASEMPAGAEVLNRKYTYTLTSYTTSGSSSLSGWTKYDTKSAWGDYGSWSGWSDNAVSASDSRQVETQQAVASYNYKTVYHYYYYSKAATNGNTSYTATDTYGKNRYTVTFDSALPKGGTVAGHQKYKWSNHHGTGKYMYVYADSPYTTQEVVSTNYKTQYRYRDRSLIYTYYYKKDEIKESTTYPSGDNISNIQEWVQYRAK